MKLLLRHKAYASLLLFVCTHINAYTSLCMLVCMCICCTSTLLHMLHACMLQIDSTCDPMLIRILVNFIQPLTVCSLCLYWWSSFRLLCSASPTTLVSNCPSSLHLVTCRRTNGMFWKSGQRGAQLHHNEGPLPPKSSSTLSTKVCIRTSTHTGHPHKSFIQPSQLTMVRM